MSLNFLYEDIKVPNEKTSGPEKTFTAVMENGEI